MADLKTKYLGLELKNPLLAASSGITNKISQIAELEKNGAGAIVLKSLFEEDIEIELKKQQSNLITSSSIYPEIFDEIGRASCRERV